MYGEIYCRQRTVKKINHEENIKSMKAFDYSLVKDHLCDNRMEAHSDRIIIEMGMKCRLLCRMGRKLLFATV